MSNNPELLAERVKETLDRVRRFETRFTRYLASKNFDTQTDLPVWKGGAVHVPSMEASLKDILAVIPPNREEDAEIIHKGTSVCWLAIDDPNDSAGEGDIESDMGY